MSYTNQDIEEARRLDEALPPGVWRAYRMVHADTQEPMSAADIGEYVRNSVLASRDVSGSDDFLFVSVEYPDGPADVALIGNGPNREAIAAFVAAARTGWPRAVAEVERLRLAAETAMRAIDVGRPELASTTLERVLAAKEDDHEQR